MKRKKNVRYEMITTNEYVEDSGLVTSYGIRCKEVKESSDMREVICQDVSGISARPDFVQNLIDKLIRYDVDPVHLKDVIDDFLE